MSAATAAEWVVDKWGPPQEVHHGNLNLQVWVWWTQQQKVLQKGEALVKDQGWGQHSTQKRGTLDLRTDFAMEEACESWTSQKTGPERPRGWSVLEMNLGGCTKATCCYDTQSQYFPQSVTVYCFFSFFSSYLITSPICRWHSHCHIISLFPSHPSIASIMISLL